MAKIIKFRQPVTTDDYIEAQKFFLEFSLRGSKLQYRNIKYRLIALALSIALNMFVYSLGKQSVYPNTIIFATFIGLAIIAGGFYQFWLATNDRAVIMNFLTAKHYQDQMGQNGPIDLPSYLSHIKYTIYASLVPSLLLGAILSPVLIWEYTPLLGIIYSLVIMTFGFTLILQTNRHFKHLKKL